MILNIKLTGNIRFILDDIIIEFIYNEIMNLSLDNSSVLEGESCIKNAHTASHLRIFNN